MKVKCLLHQMRLNKFLAHAGVASRRKCDEFISKGKVTINGKVVRDFSYNVSENDLVMCDRHLIDTVQERVVYLLNKPKGYICTNNDTHKRKKVIDLIPTHERLFTVGRLDRDTTGAILLTNDGDLANKLMHPKYNKKKVYLVETKKDIDPEKLKTLPNGIRLDKGEWARGEIRLLDKYNGKFLWEVILTEGKNREVKRIFDAFDSKVFTLHRYSFAGLTVDHLKLGKYKQLNKKTVQSLQNS